MVEKEFAELNQAPLGESTAAVAIALARRIGLGEQRLVTRFFTREPTRHGPKARPDTEPLEQGMRHQPRDSSIAVEKGMDPQEAVVDRADRLDFP